MRICNSSYRQEFAIQSGIEDSEIEFVFFLKSLLDFFHVLASREYDPFPNQSLALDQNFCCFSKPKN